MNEELKQLFEQKERAHHQYRAMQQINVFGKSMDDRIAIDLAAETARQKWLSAMTEYNKAVEKTVKDGQKS